MAGVRLWGAVTVLGAACLLAPVGQSQAPKAKTPPKLEPVADTKLLMQALADPNFRGLGKLLTDRPKDDEAWGFARGQAILLAETGNLLMIRPPKTRDAQDTWMTRASDLRDNGSALAKMVAAKDYLKSRAALAEVANSCNHCHQAFRVAHRVNPFPEE